MKRVTGGVLVLAGFLLCLWLWRAPAYAAPYVSCPGGYIAPELEDCPNIPQDRGGKREPTPAGGANPGKGVLGNLLDSIGLGGLGGLL